MPVPRPRAVLALAIAAALGTPAAARADNLDVALAKDFYAIKNFLAEHKVRNVGVLNFRVQKGTGPESFGLGSLSTTIPLRVETLLVVTNDPKTPLGVVKDAAGTAARHNAAWFNKPTERQKLFGFSDYRLAWQAAPVKPDAFLTGRAKLSPDLASVTVTVEALLAAAPLKLQKVTEFKVDTDRALLRELGQSFAAPRNLPKTRAERDKQAVADARRRDVAPNGGTPDTPDNVRGVRVRILYDNVPQNVRPDDRSPGEWRVAEPQAGQKVAIELSHSGQEEGRRGAVLRVNGQSAWAQSQGPDDDPDTGIWIVDSGKPALTFRGYIFDVKGQNLVPFRVLSREESAGREAEFADKVGLIDIDVCGTVKGPDPDGEVLSISRGLSRSLKPAAAPKTSEELRRQLLDKNPLLKKAAAALSSNRGLIVGEGQTIAGPEIVMDQMPDRQKLGRITIRYYDSQGSGAMQISK